MANSFTEIQVTGVDSYTFAIPYLSQDHIKVFVGGTLQTLNTHYTFTDTYTIEFTAGNIPADTSEYIVIKRDTSTVIRLVTYSNTGLDADDLNRDSDQVFYMAQEAVDAVEGSMIQDESLNFDAQGKRIVNVADPVGPQDVATSKYVAEQIAGAQGAVTVSETAPTDNTKGDLWIDSSDNIMHVWTGHEWVNGGVQETARFDFLGSDASGVVDGRAIFPQSLHDLDSASITQLYLNGVLLKPTTAALDFTTGDYDLFDGAGISINPAPVGSDEITVIKSATISSVLLDEIDNLKNSAALITTAAHGGKSVKESFTATAGQTVINLANTYVQNINNVSVYVNGVRQDDYSESTTTSITLTNPLSLGDEIVVIINEYAVNQNGLDMGLVTYTPEGTGAVERTLGSKLGETVSVKDFGAKGDGVTDDTSAIQAAIDSLTLGGVVYFPVGIFIGAFVQNSLVTLQGAGINATTLKKPVNHNGAVITSKDFASLTGTNAWTVGNDNVPYGMGLYDLTIDGNKDNSTTGDGLAYYAKGYQIDRVLVKDCTGSGFYSECGNVIGQVDYKDTPEAKIYNLQSRDNGASGIVFRGPHDAIFDKIIANANGNKGFVNEFSTGVYDGHCNIRYIHTYANTNGGIDLGHTAFCGMLFTDGDGLTIAGNNCVIDAVRNLSVTGNGTVISGFGNVIGSIKTNLHSTASGKALVITGVQNRISNVYVAGGNTPNTGVDIDANNVEISDLFVSDFDGDAIQIGRTGSVKGVSVKADVTNCTTGLNYITQGTRNNIDLSVFTGAGQTAVVGNLPNALDRIEVVEEGTNDSKTFGRFAGVLSLNQALQTINIPHNLTFTPTSSQIQLSLVKVSGATDYSIDWMRIGAVDAVGFDVEVKLSSVSSTPTTTCQIIAQVDVSRA